MRIIVKFDPDPDDKFTEQLLRAIAALVAPFKQVTGVELVTTDKKPE